MTDASMYMQVLQFKGTRFGNLNKKELRFLLKICIKVSAPKKVS